MPSGRDIGEPSQVDGAEAPAVIFDVDGVLVKQTTTRAGADGWACQHAFSVVAKMSVEAKVCGYQVQDQAAAIVDKLASNAR